ncbi:hypothetical protein KGF57_001086 [Candida theae]|uniref:Uncharacterized protein n=1 Tax=Candida theae TaxID=1198502 RepID=A0AAD5BHR4_9ASCO|nr:uncharacterized protein KGF57_001086 [Candida theae]KAI5964413.1 hypothetical protein KGF57_001086 [Candida theae]
MRHRSRYSTSSKNFTRKRKRQEKFKKFVKKDIQPLEAKYATHGQSNLNFIDTQITTTMSYPWSKVTPNQLQHSKSTKPLRTLVHICAETIASQAHKITPDLMTTLPWSIWKKVWTMILATNQDSLQVYTIFLRHFGHFTDFKGHKSHITNVRDETIAFTQVPQNRLHRIETLFANVLIPDMTQGLAKVGASVILDMSRMPMVSKEEYFSIFNVPNLICLDLSNQEIDVIFLHHLGSCIATGTKLNQLVLIKLANTKVTPLAVLKFLNAISFRGCKLAYIELDFEIKHRHWRLLDPGKLKIVQTMPMGLSVNALTRSDTTSPHSPVSPQLNKLPLLDIFIAKESYDSTYNMEDIWRSRNRAMNSIKKRTTFVYEKISPTEWPYENGAADLEEKPQRQKRALKTNARDFFEL